MPRPRASSVPTPETGNAPLSPSARAVAMPTRRPVKEPGPTPTAIRPTASQPPTAAAARSSSPSSAVVCNGPRRSEGPRSASKTTSPSRSAQAAVSAVAVSKPTVISARLPRNREDGGADAFALDEPAHPVLARDVGGDLVDVERPLDSFLFRGAEVFFGREFDANRVEDIRSVAAEESALVASLLADVRGFCVLGETAGDVVLVGGGFRGGGSHTGQQRHPQHDRRQRLRSLHSALPPSVCISRPMLQGGIPHRNTAICGAMRSKPRFACCRPRHG